MKIKKRGEARRARGGRSRYIYIYIYIRNYFCVEGRREVKYTYIHTYTHNGDAARGNSKFCRYDVAKDKCLNAVSLSSGSKRRSLRTVKCSVSRFIQRRPRIFRVPVRPRRSIFRGEGGGEEENAHDNFE